MDNYSFSDDDDIPTIPSLDCDDDPPPPAPAKPKEIRHTEPQHNHRERPPREERPRQNGRQIRNDRKHSQPQPYNEQSHDESNGRRQSQPASATHFSQSQTQSLQSQDNLFGIFEIDNHSYDVILSETKLSWTSVTGKDKVPKTRKRSSFFKRNSRSSMKASMSFDEEAAVGPNALLLKDIVGARVKRERRAGQGEGEGICMGVAVFTFQRSLKDPQKFKEQILLLGHPSEAVSVNWCQRILQTIRGYPERPRQLRVFLQPFAGKKMARTIYNHRLIPLLEAADVKVELTEVNHNEHIKQEIIHMDTSYHDSVVIMGGDGTVTAVISNLLTMAQKDSGIDTRPDFRPTKLDVTIGIIPVGHTNTIAHSVMGTDDLMTGFMHTLLGHTHPVDVCSVHKGDKLDRWAFNSHYGFFGCVLPLMKRYELAGDKKIEAAVVKALTKSKFRPYKCEVSYVPAPESCGTTTDGRCCTQGCRVCCVDVDKQPEDCVIMDEVQSLDPLNSSGASSIDLGEMEDKWKTIKGDFLNVSLFSLPSRLDMAPRGASMYTHLADGSLDLVFCGATDRKEFVRFLRRHGNAKCQFSFPFVQTKRCREVRFHVRSNETWKHKDHNFSEITYEIDRNRRKSEFGNRSKSMEMVVDDLGETSDEDSDLDDEDFESTIKSSSAGSRKSVDSAMPSSLANLQHTNVSTNYRPTFVEQERSRRAKHRRKKDEKKKTKAEARMKTVWNIDNEICIDLDLLFKIHSGLVKIHGLGVLPHYEPDDVKLTCLSVF